MVSHKELSIRETNVLFQDVLLSGRRQSSRAGFGNRLKPTKEPKLEPEKQRAFANSLSLLIVLIPLQRLVFLTLDFATPVFPQMFSRNLSTLSRV